jgi:cytochrome c-type biogenesis protein CcsB
MDDRLKKIANGFLCCGFAFSSFFLFLEGSIHRVYLPVTSLYQALFFFSWSMVLIYFLLSWRLNLDTFGLVLLPLVLSMSLTAGFFYREDIPPIPYQKDRWFITHVLAAFLAYASFALSFVGALLYLLQNRELKLKKTTSFYHKLPSLEVLEKAVYRTIALGFPMLTLALLSGFIWTEQVFGAYWHWDPKIILSSITWLIYLAIILAHYLCAFRGRKIVLISVFAFGCVLLTFLGVNFFESSVHAFLK